MAREVISIPDAPQSPTYSQAVKVGDTVYVAGTTRIDVTTGDCAGPTVTEQARQSLRNCQAILRAAGADLTDAVMVHTLLARPEDADALSAVLNEFYPDIRPPRCVSRIGVDRPGLLVSIAIVAVTDRPLRCADRSLNRSLFPLPPPRGRQNRRTLTAPRRPRLGRRSPRTRARRQLVSQTPRGSPLVNARWTRPTLRRRAPPPSPVRHPNRRGGSA